MTRIGFLSALGLLLSATTVPAAIVTVKTSDGSGADSYVQAVGGVGSNTNFGTETAIRTKNAGTTAPQTLSRKGYLKFELPDLLPVGASLELTVDEDKDSTGYTFNIYGLNESASGDSWGETTINWNNAPGNDSSFGGADPTETTLLGQFGGGVPGSVVGISNQALVDFVNADTNGLATFILTRDTFDTNYFGPIHFFRSKEYVDTNDAFAPRLLLETPEPTTLLIWSLLAGLGVGLGWRRRK